MIFIPRVELLIKIRHAICSSGFYSSRFIFGVELELNLTRLIYGFVYAYWNFSTALILSLFTL